MPEPLHTFESWVIEGFTHDTFWIALSAIVSACVAVATFRLASFTRQLAEDTASTIQESQLDRAQTDYHHQEALSPLVLVVADVWLEHREQFEEDHEHPVQDADGFVTPGQGPPYMEAHISLDGKIINIGTGPAADISIMVTPSSFAMHEFTLTPMAADSAQALSLFWDFKASGEPYPMRRPVSFEVRVNYGTIFGTHGVSHQRSHSGFGKDLKIAEDHKRPVPRPRTV